MSILVNTLANKIAQTPRYVSWVPVGAYILDWNKLSRPEQRRIVIECGADQVSLARQVEHPIVLYVVSPPEDEEFMIGKVPDTYNNSDTTLTPIDKETVNAFLCAVEMCEFNTHLLLAALSGKCVTIRLPDGKVTDVVEYGQCSCTATLKTNPLLVSQPTTNDVQHSGCYMTGNTMNHSMVWVDVLEEDGSKTRWHIDTTAKQIDMFGSRVSYSTIRPQDVVYTPSLPNHPDEHISYLKRYIDEYMYYVDYTSPLIQQRLQILREFGIL